MSELMSDSQRLVLVEQILQNVRIGRAEIVDVRLVGRRARQLHLIATAV